MQGKKINRRARMKADRLNASERKRKLSIFLLVAGLLALALLLRLSGIWREAPIDYHPDEWVLAKPVFVLANNAEAGMKTHYKWPGCGVIYLVGYLLYAMKAFFGPYSYATILIILRVLSAVASTGAVLLCFILMRKLFSNTAALFSTALLAVAKLPVAEGHHGSVTSIVSLVILAVILLTYDIFNIDNDSEVQSIKPARCCGMGVLLGWGIASKWTIILAAIPISGALFLSIFYNRKQNNWPAFIKTNLKKIAIVSGVAAIIFLASIPDFSMSPSKVISGFTYEMKHHNTGHYGTITAEAGKFFKKINRTYKVMSVSGNQLIAFAGIAAIIMAFIKPSRSKAFLLWIFLIWLAVVFRNMIAMHRHHLIPFIIMLMFVGVMLASGADSRRRHLRVGSWCVFTLLMVSALLYSCIAMSPYWKPDGRVECGKWIIENVPDGSGVTWAPRTSDWTVPGNRVFPELFKKFSRKAESGKYQYIIAGQPKLGTFRRHPPEKPVVASEWFPSKPPTIQELRLYAEMNAGEGPNLVLVKKFNRASPSFLGLTPRLFFTNSNISATHANCGVNLYRFKRPLP